MKRRGRRDGGNINHDCQKVGCNHIPLELRVDDHGRISVEGNGALTRRATAAVFAVLAEDLVDLADTYDEPPIEPNMAAWIESLRGGGHS